MKREKSNGGKKPWYNNKQYNGGEQKLDGQNLIFLLSISVPPTISLSLSLPPSPYQPASPPISLSLSSWCDPFAVDEPRKTSRTLANSLTVPDYSFRFGRWFGQ